MDTINNKKFTLRMIISYSSLLFIIMIMGAYLYNFSIKNISSEIRKQNKSVLTNAISFVDMDFGTMDALAGQISSNNLVIKLTGKEDNTDNDFYLLASKAKTELLTYIPIEMILPIRSYFIYLQNSQYILSYSQFESTSIYYHGKERYNDSLYDEWMSMINDVESYRKFIPMSKYKESNDDYCFYMLYLDKYSMRKVPSVLYFEIDLNQIREIFNDINLFGTGFICVVDEDNDLMFNISDTMTGQIDVNYLESLNYEDGYASYGSLDNEMFVTKVNSKYNNWTYYLVQPTYKSLYMVEQYRDIYLIIILLALILEFMLIVILSKTNVKPMIRLDNELKDTIASHKTLETIYNEQKPMIQDSYWNRILHGEISTEKEFEYACNYLGIANVDDKYTVLHIVSYLNQNEFYTDEAAITVPESEDYEKIIRDAIVKYFPNTMYVIKTEEREYSVLLTAKADVSVEELEKQTIEQFIHLHQNINTEQSIWLIGGIGIWNNGLILSWKSYQQAIEASSYTTKQHIVLSYGEIKRDTNSYYYPIELAGQLTNFITSGNESQTMELFDIIQHENMEVRSLPINMMKYLLSDIRNTLYKIRFTISENEDNKEDLQIIDKQFEEHKSIQLFEKISINLCKIYNQKTSGNQLIQNIMTYIQDNFHDPSLCLHKISDEFSISESYFSYLFKEETGTNFSVYLEKIRMEQAMRLIRETNINISDLFQEVGYNNSNTFRRAFKKIYGVSPKAFRDANGGNN